MIKQKPYLLDTNKSCITHKEIRKFRSEITKNPSGKVCNDSSTLDLIHIGSQDMKANNFHLVTHQLDI